MLTTKPATINEYISAFPEATQKLLEQVRATIKKTAPDAVETISYGMPAFKLNGILIYFAGYKNHIGLYPGAKVIEDLKDELSAYKTSKGTVQLPLEKLPSDLITKIVKYKIVQNQEKVNRKK